MPETVLWDTSALVALGNADDNLHDQAVGVSEELKRQRLLILTTSAILAEGANTFSRAPWRPVAQAVVESVRQSVGTCLATLVHVDAGLWERGCSLFLARPDKDWGLTDCISFVMQDRGIARAFTSDRHFEQAGFTRLMEP